MFSLCLRVDLKVCVCVCERGGGGGGESALRGSSSFWILWTDPSLTKAVIGVLDSWNISLSK